MREISLKTKNVLFLKPNAEDKKSPEDWLNKQNGTGRQSKQECENKFADKSKRKCGRRSDRNR